MKSLPRPVLLLALAGANLVGACFGNPDAIRGTDEPGGSVGTGGTLAAGNAGNGGFGVTNLGGSSGRAGGPTASGGVTAGGQIAVAGRTAGAAGSSGSSGVPIAGNAGSIAGRPNGGGAGSGQTTGGSGGRGQGGTQGGALGQGGLLGGAGPGGNGGLGASTSNLGGSTVEPATGGTSPLGGTGGTGIAGDGGTAGAAGTATGGVGGSAGAPPSCDPGCGGHQGTWACVNGSCELTGCELGWDNCDDQASTGCETDLNTIAHCGSCTQSCAGGHATWGCGVGVCTITTCESGWDDCDATALGCEHDVTADAQNCGRCGRTCASGVCRSQACLTLARYGNVGTGTTTSAFPKGYLAGIQIYVGSPGVLTALGVVIATGAATRTMYLGLYRDEAGVPTTLLAGGSTQLTVPAGGVEAPVPQLDLAQGTYWIMGVWDDTASFAANSSTNVSWRYTTYTLGALPATAPTSMPTTPAPAPNFYVVLAQ